MKSFALPLLVAGALLSPLATAQDSFMGLKVFKQDFPIGGGKTLALPTTEHGPIPATAEGVTVEIAGPVAIPASTPDKVHLAWGFSISVPKNAAYQHVEIVNLSNEPPTILVDQAKPVARVVKIPDGSELNVLQLRGAGADVGRATTPWVYQPESSVFVFRVKLEDASGKTVTLHQPAVFGEDTKVRIRQMADQAAIKAPAAK